MSSFVVSLVLALVVTTSAFAQRQETFARREFFYIGGKYSGAAGSEVMHGQMYVEVLRPQRVTKKYPIVFFHGGKQTATNWMQTPDGRSGWSAYFLHQGYVVYLTDQPARGRTAWHPSLTGPMSFYSSVQEAYRLTAPALFGTWPQAKKHTQWPGVSSNKGRMGDP